MPSPRPLRAPRELKRRTGGRSARVREAVLKEAFSLLVERGYDDFSIGEVAARSGVHETSIYRRWKTKTGLLLAACLDFAAEVISVPDTGTIRGDLLEFLRRIRRTLQSPEGKALLALAALTDPASIAARQTYWQRRFENASEIVIRAKARGEIATETDATLLLETLVAPLYFRVMVSFGSLKALPLENMVDRWLASHR